MRLIQTGGSQLGRGLIASILCASAVAACSGGGGNDTDGSGVVVVGAGEQSVPGDTLSDWKDYSDAVIRFAVTGERSEPVDERTEKTGEGLVNRVVTISVDQVYWDLGRVPLPNSLDLQAWGWALHDGERRLMVAVDVPRLEIGHTYLAAIAQFDDGWATLGAGASVPFEDDSVGTGEWRGDPDGRAPDGTAIALLLGKNSEEVAAAIDAVKPDALALQYRDLGPVERYQQVKKSGG